MKKLTLCIDVGNTDICYGVFSLGTLILHFRANTKAALTSDEIGLFIKQALQEHDINYKNIIDVYIASVVPAIEHSLETAINMYLKLKPEFLHYDNSNHLVKAKALNPQELGADLLAGAIAAIDMFPVQNTLVFDLGTATTASYINKKREFVGAIISPGVKLMIDTLATNTAKLSSINIVKPDTYLGNNTKAAIQLGIYYAQLGLINETVLQIHEHYSKELFIIGTGGYSYLFEQAKCFHAVFPNLVLKGIYVWSRSITGKKVL